MSDQYRKTTTVGTVHDKECVRSWNTDRWNAYYMIYIFKYVIIQNQNKDAYYCKKNTHNNVFVLRSIFIFGTITLYQVWSILPAFELLPARWTVEGEQLQCGQNGSNLIYHNINKRNIASKGLKTNLKSLSKFIAWPTSSATTLQVQTNYLLQLRCFGIKLEIKRHFLSSFRW